MMELHGCHHHVQDALDRVRRGAAAAMPMEMTRIRIWPARARVRATTMAGAMPLLQQTRAEGNRCQKMMLLWCLECESKCIGQAWHADMV